VQSARPKDIHFQTKHVYSNYCSVQQCLTGAKRSKTVGAALRIWHTRHPPHITDWDTHAKAHQMVQCDHAMLHHIGEHPGISETCSHGGSLDGQSHTLGDLLPCVPTLMSEKPVEILQFFVCLQQEIYILWFVPDHVFFV
jgi:hypothetical protein